MSASNNPSLGSVDGECVERIWSRLRDYTVSTRNMSSAHRDEQLEDAILFWRLRSESTLVSRLIKAYRQAKEEVDLWANTQEELPSRLSGDVSIFDPLISEIAYKRTLLKTRPSGTRFATRILKSIKKLNDKIKELSRKGHALPASRDAFNTTLKRERAQAELALAQEDLQRLMLRYDRSAIHPDRVATISAFLNEIKKNDYESSSSSDMSDSIVSFENDLMD